MIEIRKFPDLMLAGRRLIWDSRQDPDGRPETVFIAADLDEDTRGRLKARSSAEFVEGIRTRHELGEAAAAALNHPSSHLCVLAVTGTNGKTSCAQMMARLFAAAGKQTAEIGTLGVLIRKAGQLDPSERIETGFTTPEAPTLQDLFAQFVQRGITHVVMEASSHAMSLGRIAGTDFDGALFTNLSQDHLDFHLTMEHYEAAKKILFTEYLPRSGSKKRKQAVINALDPAGKRILLSLPLSVNAQAFIAGKTFDVISDSLAGQTLRFDGGAELFETGLIGLYNAENSVGSYLLCMNVLSARNEDVDGPHIWKRALAHYAGPAGRMQRIPDLAGRHVFVDYAHTPDALEKALKVLKGAKGNEARLWVVFGCGGDRDRTKRPLMGRAAIETADRTVVTSDNPRTEQPQAIMDDIAAGIPTSLSAKVEFEIDRRVAIERALGQMKSGDVCLVAGKGHENYQIIGSEKRAFSDVEVCREWLSKH